MASEFDELVERLLYDVALSGDEGLSLIQLHGSIDSFYQAKHDKSNQLHSLNDEDLLFTCEPPTTRMIVDDKFLESTWDWLSKQREVHVRTFKPASPTLPGATINEQQPQDTIQPSSSELPQASHDITGEVIAKYDSKRLTTTPDRLWHAITGHGVDNSRIKGAEFKLLLIIAKHGAAGITQPELVKQSKQDKRSVPKRTDSLAHSGYISKRAVISLGMRTSLLTLKKFGDEQNETTESNGQSAPRIIYYEKWYEQTIRSLHDNNNVLALSDLRAELGIANRQWEMKALDRCLRRLVASGCIRKLKAKVAEDIQAGRERYVHCVQLLREPSESDRSAFMSTSARTQKARGQAPSKTYPKGGRQTTNADDAVDFEDSDDGDDDDDDDDDLENADGPDTVEERMAAQWTPDLPLQNFVFDMIAHAGVAGISIMDLHRRCVGPLWRRPMDELLMRLCDTWERSQPPHLRHLSLIKDTAAKDRTTFFKYRTLAAFSEAVADGEAFWEAIQGKSNATKKKEASGEPVLAAPELNQWGFPVLPPKLFAGGRDGTATLDQCLKGLKVEPLMMANEDATNEFTETGHPTTPRASRHALKPTRRPGLAAKNRAVKTSKTRTSHPLPNHSVGGAELTPLDAAAKQYLPEKSESSQHPEASLGRRKVLRATAKGVVQSMPIKRGRPTKAMVAERERSLRVAEQEQARAISPDTVSRVASSNSSGPTGKKKRKRAEDSAHSRAPDDRSDAIAQVKHRRLVQLNDRFGSLEVLTDQSRPSSPLSETRDSLVVILRSHRLKAKESRMASELPAGPHTQDEALNNIAQATSLHEALDVQVTGDGKSSREDSASNNAGHAAGSNFNNTASDDEQHLEIPTICSPNDVDGKLARVQKKAGVARTQGAVQMKRTKLILDVVQKCGGVYPGNREMWYPVAMVMMQTNGTVVDKTTVDNSIKDLLNRGKLRKLTFQFRNQKGLVVNRSVLAEPTVKPGDPRVREMQKEIIKSHPSQYLPPEAGIPSGLRYDLDKRSHARRMTLAEQDSETGGLLDSGPVGKNGSLPNEPVIVQRTAMGLDVEAAIRQALPPKSVSEPSAPRVKRRKLPPEAYEYSDDDDEDEEAASPEQRKLTSQYQLNHYKHDFSHAFLERKNPRSRLSKMFDANKLAPSNMSMLTRWGFPSATFSLNGTRTGLPGLYNGMEGYHPLSRPLMIETEKWRTRHAHMRLRSMALMNGFPGPKHDFSGTFGSACIVPENDTMLEQLGWLPTTGPGMPHPGLSSEHLAQSQLRWTTPVYPHTINQFQPFSASVLAKNPSMRPFQRLQTLGSSLWNANSFNGPTLSPFTSQNLGGNHEMSRDTNLSLFSRSMGLSDGTTLSPVPFSVERGQTSTQARSKRPLGIPDGLYQEQASKKHKSLSSTRIALGLEHSFQITSNMYDDHQVVQPDPAPSFLSQVPGPAYVTTKKRDRRSPRMFEDGERLARAVALYRALLGGLDQRNNWGIIAHMLSFKYEPEFLRRRWAFIKNAREEGVQKLVERTYEPFLAAYERGDLPTIDFGNMSGVAWPDIMQWFEESVLAPGEGMEIQLPSLPLSVNEFHEGFSMTESSTLWEHSKESWFTLHYDKGRRDLAHEFVYGVALPGHSRPGNEFPDSKAVLKSWVRAIAMTQHDRYKPEQAALKIAAYSDQAIKAVCDEMVTEKFLRHMNKGRQQRGRNFELHEASWSVFRRWPGKSTEYRFLREVASSRESILDKLRHSHSIELGYCATDTEILVLFNMLSQGLLQITTQLPERNDDFEAPFPKISAFGYSGYNYNAKTLDRSRLRFPVSFEKTEMFTPNHGLKSGISIPMRCPVGSKLDDGRIPFWIDIHGNFNASIWDLVLRSVLYVVVFRPGCTASAIEQSHNHRLYTWEIDLILDWMEKTALTMRFGAGQEDEGVWKGGWRASEWWYCAFSSDVATWKAPGVSVN